MVIPVGRTTEVRIEVGPPKAKLWARRNVAWVPKITSGPCQIKYLQLTNLSDREIILNHGASLALWMTSDMIPRSPGYVSIGSRRYTEWQTLTFEATTEREEETVEEYTEPLMDHPVYECPLEFYPAKRQKYRGSACRNQTKKRPTGARVKTKPWTEVT